MPNRFISFFDFVSHFFRYAMFLREAFVGLVSLLLLGGVLISWLENIPLGHAIYFARQCSCSRCCQSERSSAWSLWELPLGSASDPRRGLANIARGRTSGTR